MRCTYKLLPTSLNNLVNLCNLPQKKTVFPFQLLEYKYLKQRFVRLHESQFPAKAAYQQFKTLYGEVVDLYNAVVQYSKSDTCLLKQVFEQCYKSYYRLGLNLLSNYTLDMIAHQSYFTTFFQNLPSITERLKQKYFQNQQYKHKQNSVKYAEWGGKIHLYTTHNCT